MMCRIKRKYGIPRPKDKVMMLLVERFDDWNDGCRSILSIFGIGCGLLCEGGTKGAKMYVSLVGGNK